MQSDTHDAGRRRPLHTKILIGLIAGAVLGAVANAFFRDETS